MDREKVVDNLTDLKEMLKLQKDITGYGFYIEFINDAIALLKEQEEETKFVYDEYTMPMCEKCNFHPFAGYVPTIKWMKERGYMKCPRCGRSVKWE